MTTTMTLLMSLMRGGSVTKTNFMHLDRLHGYRCRTLDPGPWTWPEVEDEWLDA